MEPSSLINNIVIQEQNLKKLSFCSSNKLARVAEWASFLRPTKFEQTSAMLYKALPEVTLLKTSAENRFEILELLRPYVQNTIVGLSKNFLNQPIALSPEAQKNAIVAQALQKHMFDSYILVVRDILNAKKPKIAETPFFAVALHRAITGIGLLLMRSYQIYAQAPKGLWLNLHTLFRIADNYDLLDKHVADEVQRIVKVNSIQNAYMQSVLLATARPHQLNQNDIRAIYDAFAEWAQYVRFSIELSDDSDCFYYINLDRDCGPSYKSRVSEDEAEDLKVELKLKSLLSQLTKQKGEASEEIGASSLKVPKDISKAVLNHLLDVWGNIAQRKQERRPIQMTAEICVGLTDCHYQLCNKLSFEAFVGEGESSIPNNINTGFTPKEAFSSQHHADKNTPSSTRMEIQNISHGGYCLLWRSESAIRVQSGDIIGIKEFGKRLWTIGVVRWIRQKKNSSQLGVQVLSDKVLPYGIAQNYDMGGYSDFMRALYVPASQLSDTPESLIVPSAPFQPMDKVKILDGDNTFKVKLNEQIFSTGNIQQLSFRRLDAAKPSNKPVVTKSDW